MAFESIFSAIKDLLKYQIINHTNTGDKTLDSLINGIMLAILATVFAVSTWSNLILTFKRRYRKNTNIKLDKDLIKYYKKYIKDHEDEFTAIKFHTSSSESENYVSNLYNYTMIHIKKPLALDNALYYDPIKKEIDKNSGIYFTIHMARQFLKNALTIEVPEPIHISGNWVVAVMKHTNDDIYFVYNTKEVFDEFIKEVEKYTLENDKNKIQPIEESKQVQPLLKIWQSSGSTVTGSSVIYPDRTIDKFVSRYKGDILQLMENFKEANEKKVSLFEGFGTYNLGIIMQGDPGTGKTAFIKAVCNYFRRDAYIVDLRTIKTRQKFADVFTDCAKYVFILEELDCIGGIIRDRSKIDDSYVDEHKQSDKLKELQERRLNVLSLIADGSTRTKSDDASHSDKTTPLSRELENINEEMKQLENALTLDTMLTTLDGPIEMRGRILIATTNHIERIDPALLREGRFDYKFHLTKFNSDEICEMLCKMFPNDVEKIKSHKYKEDKYTPVQIISIVSLQRHIDKVIEILAVS
jgi:ATP-dependent 26S proteasome regulatory subunit